ncbi:MAG: anhydro-N-acetylmuramic acid kinase [Ignavibacteriae bacterium]|nr:anhydro-N-acetylmuramic acid kinase [Ignavibacteriota bacterium]
MFKRIQNKDKKKKLIIGLMSGTSADGIDAALTEIVGNGIQTRVNVLAFETFPYPTGFKKFLLKNSDANTARLDDVARLNFLIGELFADAVIALCKKANVNIENIDLIGSHGQTIQHLPETKKLFGKDIRATLQVGEPSVIAKRTGIVTVGDFRVADVAVGGTGAPLVPYVDYLLFRSEKKNRALLNIGGIANITVLPKSCSLDEMSAFDTGPGNMAIDALMKKFYNRAYDMNGEVASSGNLIPELLHRMMEHSYLKMKPPKSTGREMFGELFVKEILAHSKRKPTEDIITTVTEFTALSVFEAYLLFIKKKTKIEELIVSGGGVHNSYLMNSLQKYFSEARVSSIEKFGMSSDAKEAVAFAILANETIAGNASNVPNATGASKQTMLGKVCLP